MGVTTLKSASPHIRLIAYQSINLNTLRLARGRSKTTPLIATSNQFRSEFYAPSFTITHYKPLDSKSGPQNHIRPTWSNIMSLFHIATAVIVLFVLTA